MIVTLVLMTGDPDVTVLPNEVIIQITDDDCKSITSLTQLVKIASVNLSSVEAVHMCLNLY